MNYKQELDQETLQLLKSIGNNIRRIRKQKGMSQADLAYSADINLTYMGYIENGKFNVTIGKLFAIVRCLGITLEEIVTIQDSD